MLRHHHAAFAPRIPCVFFVVPSRMHAAIVIASLLLLCIRLPRLRIWCR